MNNGAMHLTVMQDEASFPSTLMAQGMPEFRTQYCDNRSSFGHGRSHYNTAPVNRIYSLQYRITLKRKKRTMAITFE